MSKVIEKKHNRELSHFVQHENGKCYYIDSCFTIDHGLETMVFPCEKDDNEWEINWGDVYDKRYSSRKSMEKHHMWLIEHLEEVELAEEW